MALNLERQLQFYGAYHHNPVNVAIHIACVPVILITAFLFATNSPDVALPAHLQIPYFPLNLGTAACLLYATLYILMEPVAGALLAPLLLGATAYANHLTSTAPRPANSYAGALHAAAWLAQFVGHGRFEGRAPALLDNLVQALFLAPLFVWLEILFAVGYRPELKRRLDVAVARDIAAFKGKGKGKESSNGHAKGSAKAE